MAVDGAQEVLEVPQSIPEILYAGHGVVRLEDLEGPDFDPERAITMAEYLGEIGLRIAARPRETSVRDKALGLYRQDFQKAQPHNLTPGLYFPSGDYRERPKELVVVITGGEVELNRRDFPGIQSPSTGVAVSQEIYKEKLKNPSYYAIQIANNVELAHKNDLNIEGAEDLGGEAAIYGLFHRHELLDARDAQLLEQRSILAAVYKSVTEPEPKRIRNLEDFRLPAMVAIQDMVRIACKGLNFGTTQTRPTLNAVVSNIHRSDKPGEWLARYSHMAMMYNDAVREKVNESIHCIVTEIGQQAEHAIHNIDRVYVDRKKSVTKQ